MKTYSQAELDEILRKHKLWLNGDPNGVRANLKGANLEGANLEGANLTRANLSGAYLSGAYLYRANLCGANLIRAFLEGASLSGARLRETTLYGTKLKETNLNGIKIDTYIWLSEDNYEDFIRQTDLKDFFIYRCENFVILETRLSEFSKVLLQNREILYIKERAN